GGVTLDISTLADDIDNDDTAATLTYALDGQPALGSASISGSTVTFTAGTTDFEYLAVGETTTVTIPVSVTDAHGDSASADITVTVTGTNDRPRITSPNPVETLPEGDAALSVSGTLDIEDVDVTDTVGLASLNPITVNVISNPGGFTNAELVDMLTVTGGIDNMSTTGTLNWSFDAAAGDFDYLDANEQARFVYQVAIQDEQNDVWLGYINIRVNGTNDGPVVTFAAGNDAGTVSEDDMSPATATGTISFVDADADDGVTSSVAFVSATGQNGATVSAALDTLLQDSATFTISQSGTPISGDVNWAFSLATAEAQYLSAGQSVDVVYNISVTDGDVTEVTPVTITITGAEDAPVITGTASGTAEEDGTQTASGTLTVTDADAVDTPTFVVQTGTTSPYGSFEVDASGNWTYTLDNATAQLLAGGEIVSEVFPVTAETADGESVTQNVIVTITGSEDAPVITGTATGDVVEDGTQTATGVLVATDADSDDTPSFLAQTGTMGTYGSFDVDASGNWTYTLDNAAVQGLAGGQSVDDTFTVTAATADGESVTQTVIVTITGTEDAPEITGVVTGDVEEDGTQTASGSLAVTDADAVDTPTFTAQPGTMGTYGTFVVDAAGNWTYSLDNALAQSVAGGETEDDVFTVTATTGDGETVTQTVTVTITGAEDAPEITGTATGAVQEDVTLSATGILVATDADAVDMPTFLAQTGTAGAYGSFDVDAAGNWTYTLDNAVAQALAGGDVMTETFTVTAQTVDGETVAQTVTVTVSGTEDDPVITGTTTGDVAEDGTQTATGALVATDADGVDTPTFTAQTGTVGTYGSFDVDVSGNWTFTLDNNSVQFLAGGQTTTDSFTVTATTTDGETATETVVVTITGDEDAPVITGTVAGNVSEDGTLVATGSLATSDVDAVDTPTFQEQSGTAGTYGTFILNTAGGWTYVLDNAAAQALSGGQNFDEVFTVTSVTGDGETVTENVTVTIAGSEDAPTITATTTGTVVEDTILTASGSLVTSDADAADSPTITAQTTAGAYGTFTAADGSGWTYTLDNAAAQALAGGVSTTEVFTVEATTGDGETVTETVTITVTGTEDAPIISGTTTGAVQEDGTLVASGIALATDADTGDIPVFTPQPPIDGGYGTFTMDGAGNWTYTLNNTTAQSLSGGQVVTENFSITAETLDGETVTDTVSITVTGTEDAPVISGTTTGAVEEDAGLVANGSLFATDSDAADTPFIVPQPGTSGVYGSFQVDMSGNWTYTLDNALAQGLSGTDMATEVFTVTALTMDGETVTQTVTITVSGAEDAPVITGTSTGSVSEDGVLAATGALVATDVDVADAPFFIAQPGTAGTYGSFNVDAGGNWTYTLDNAAAQGLAAGDTMTETFSVTAQTADGESVSQTVTVTVIGAEDAPVITGTATGAVSEDGVLAATGTLAAS
ncbi:VCBS domain-containing protein, partial [Shimia sp. SDUM112013]|uniref:beta strand repeat-containing protein n=1 Tax=Shimia sp. SDUM112013 TaxID=3136160 RepID=UPI0032EC44AE